MKAVPVWLRYTLLRVLLFAAPLIVLLVAGVTPWIAVLVAAVFGFSASLIFLRTQREELARDLYAARNREVPLARDDAEAEDAAVEASGAVAAPAESVAPTEPVAPPAEPAAPAAPSGPAATEPSRTATSDRRPTE